LIAIEDLKLETNIINTKYKNACEEVERYKLKTKEISKLQGEKEAILKQIVEHKKLHNELEMHASEYGRENIELKRLMSNVLQEKKAIIEK